jgi:hypothetical protein
MQNEHDNDILAVVPTMILIRLTVAMGWHPRLGKESILSLLDEGLVCTIACYAMPEFSETLFWRLCQIMMFDHFKHDFDYSLVDYTFIINLPEPFYSNCDIRVSACGFPSDDVSDSSGSQENVDILMEDASIYLRHSTFHAFMKRPSVITRIDGNRELGGIVLIDPRDEANTVDEIGFMDNEEVELVCYQTKSYTLAVDADFKQLLNIVDIAINIATTTSNDFHPCTKCGAPVPPLTEDGVWFDDDLCADCV